MKTTPKDFFLHIGVIVTLYLSTASLLNLLFTVINEAFPKITGARYYFTPSISWPVAALIVVFPLFLLLAWLIGKSFEADPTKRDSVARKSFVWLTLFLAGAAIAGDLIAVIYYFLDGQEITTAFLLKVLSVLVVAGLIFVYFLMDIRNRLTSGNRMIFRIVAIVLVLGSILWGFSIIGSPRTQRLIRMDQEKISNLQEIQSQILNYWTTKEMVPESLDELNDQFSGYVAPRDPQHDQPYEYRKVSAISFELCADFNRASTGQERSQAMYPVFDNAETWNHEEGRTCFTRTIDPTRYPTARKMPM
jgi:hypothetical protein